ncbi:MAG: S-methyl-5'-thioadenosine phosphorylase [Candidatus Bathyarchaeia archaeon]|nr:S-methyl-5'-thioadenosine phosphorylase [Candidatus Bathyarchaeota archaeon]
MGAAVKGVSIAVIGGTGLEEIFNTSEITNIGTPYGISYAISICKIQNKEVAFLPRHGRRHDNPPHRVNYRANIYALYKLGVERIIATNAVGAINPKFKPGDLVVPHDLIDFTRQRPLTFYDQAPVTHIDFTEPYCPEIRKILIEKAREVGTVHEQAVYVCTEGPRFETPAEIRMFRLLGCDVVGMTGMPEAVLARELGICYATICFVSNMAAGLSDRLTYKEVLEVSKAVMPKIRKVISEAILSLPEVRGCQCHLSAKLGRLEEK